MWRLIDGELTQFEIPDGCLQPIALNTVSIKLFREDKFVLVKKGIRKKGIPVINLERLIDFRLYIVRNCIFRLSSFNFTPFLDVSYHARKMH